MPGMKLQYILQAQAPVAILSSRVNAQFAKTLDYLPGSAVRGAFAEIFINKRDADDFFRQIFVDEKIRFGDFWPGYDKARPILLPLSASACKRYGLKHVNSLRDRLLEGLLQIEPDDEAKTCPHCNEPRHRISGGYLQALDPVKAVAIHKQLRMHVGISRARGAAAHGLLFSYDMLTEKARLREDEKHKPLYFIGTLESEAENAGDLFAELRTVVPQKEHISVGKAKTRGLGEMCIHDCHEISKQKNEEAEKQDFVNRWQEFNRAAQAMAGSKKQCYFSITLDSHLILKDKLGRPILTGIGPEDFGLEDDVASSELPDCIKSLSKVTVSGWNAVQGLPKPDTPALGRGSVLAFCAPKTEAAVIIEKLQDLEARGLGERRAEGFGRFTVCHPFHTKFVKENT